MNKRKATQIVRGQHAVDGAGVRLRWDASFGSTCRQKKR